MSSPLSMEIHRLESSLPERAGDSSSFYIPALLGVKVNFLDLPELGWVVSETDFSLPMTGKQGNVTPEIIGLAEKSVQLGTLVPGLPMLVGASAFRAAVLALVTRIPLGLCAGYGAVARALGNPGAARAVGYTMRTNPLAPLVPCHRVVGAAGHMTGYQGLSGIPRKVRYLKSEGVALVEERGSFRVSNECFMTDEALEQQARQTGILDFLAQETAASAASAASASKASQQLYLIRARG